jgi:hypothetical protein
MRRFLSSYDAVRSGHEDLKVTHNDLPWLLNLELFTVDFDEVSLFIVLSHKLRWNK